MGTEPTADRPIAVGYFDRAQTDGLLPWSFAVDVMQRTRNPILSTVRSDGRAHAMPIWGIWLDGRYCISTAITSVKSRNLLANRACVITSSADPDAVVLEGDAKLAALPDGFTAAYKGKYGQTIDEGPIWVVRPRVAFAFQADDNFARTATRWTWPAAG
jgi:hypothetical protein